MSKETALLLVLTCSMTLVMILRVFGDWLTIKNAISEGTVGEQEELDTNLHGWQSRHLAGAGLALLLLTAIGQLPLLKGLEEVHGILSGYSGISISFAVIEMMMRQKLAAASVRSGRRH